MFRMVGDGFILGPKVLPWGPREAGLPGKLFLASHGALQALRLRIESLWDAAELESRQEGPKEARRAWITKEPNLMNIITHTHN